MKNNDPVNNPKHYKSHPSGIECIRITEHMKFNTGNAIKYIWRADLKENALQDLKKAKWYIEREIQRLTKNSVVIPEQNEQRMKIIAQNGNTGEHYEEI